MATSTVVVVLLAVSFVVLRGPAGWALGLTSAPAPSPSVTVTLPADVIAARDRLTSAMDGAESLVTVAQGQAPADVVAALARALQVADAARSGQDAAAMDTAAAGLATARAAVVAAQQAWAANQEQQAAAAAAAHAAQLAAAAAARTAVAASPGPTPVVTSKPAARAGTKPPAKPVEVAPAPVEAPHPVEVVAPAPLTSVPSASPTGPQLDMVGYFTADLAAVGGTWVTVSQDWASVCKQADAGPNYIQGCAITTSPTVIYMKPVPAELAATDTARGVVLHEYAHLLQYKLGYSAVRDAADAVYGVGHGIEQSADCMAIAMGAHGMPGGYTSDCSGARGTLAAAFLAGRLP